MQCGFLFKIHLTQTNIMNKIFKIYRPVILLAFVFLMGVKIVFAQKIERVEPPFWWTGMKEPSLQLMVYGSKIGQSHPDVDYPGLIIREIQRVENPDYLFISLEVTETAQPGMAVLQFRFPKGKPLTYSFALKERAPGSAQRQGFDTSDAIYLLMPDRFANGNPDNDNVPRMVDRANRNNPDGRHGGDLKGIENHLDYIAGMGFSALWINPVFECNVKTPSYHGYSITDFYRVDPRLGSNDDYKTLVDKAHKNGLKVIKDMVFNHFGDGHYWMKNLPMPDWINQWPTFTRSNFRAGALTDPYAAEADKDKMLKGWFDVMMADLNQGNPLVANYLIQNSIWWIEFAGIDGIRMDTYPYSERNFMAEWMRRIRQEYPNFSVVGEVWLNSPQQVAYWQQNKRNGDGFNSLLDHVFDFPLKYAVGEAFMEPNGWATGAAKLYETLSYDFLYEDPQKIIAFADNHDFDRIFNTLGEDVRKLRMALVLLATTRGLPQIYYGTEILMKGWENQGHGFIRQDFPGGWPNDSVNAFNGNGLSEQQTETQAFVKHLMHWRRKSEAIIHGKLKHYIPEEGVYVYFRYTDEQSVMVVINNNEESRSFRTERFAKSLEGYSTGTDVLSRTYFDQLRIIHVPAMTARIIELQK